MTATNYTFTNLNPGTHYYFKVENTCGSETFGYEVDAYTECAAITLPFFEDFNSWGVGSGSLPNCWYRTGSYSTYTYISASYNMTGTSGGSIYMYSSTGTNYSTIVLPKLDTSLYQVNQTQLIFSALYTSTVYGRPKFEVGVLTDPENFNTFVPVDTVQHSGGITRWETFEVPLTSYTGNGAYVALRTVYDSNYTYPYLDDFTLELAPTCPRPDSLNATNATTNSVDLSWHERGGASQWIIEYGAWGFELGTGTQLVVNSNPFTLAGLPSAFRGEYYVKSICGIGDTGDFSRTSYRFETTQLPATIPYHYDFENAVEWANWSTSSNSTVYNWHRGTNVVDSGSYAMYVASSDSTYYSYTFDAITNVAAFRDIDFGTIDSSYTLTFRARAGGTINNYYDGLMVFLVDPAIPTVPSNTGITSPWGNVNDLYRIATMRVDTTWQTYTASFDTIHGVHRVAFFWFNQNTGASYANIPQAAAVDNIHIDYSPCPRPVNLDTMAVGGNSATLTWSGASSANYEVAYRVYGASASTTQFLYTTTNNASLSGLNATTQYIFWVRKLCGVGDSSLWSDGYVFETKLCDGGTFVLTGNPDSTSTTSYNAPVNNYYKYTLSETIFDSIELGGPMEISSIAYYYDYTTASTQKTDVTIWLQPTNKSSFSSTSDLILLDTTIAVQVYHGHLNCAQGWNYFGFATPYQYNGGNLVVIVDDNSNAYNSSTYVFKTVACSTTRTLTWYSDSYNPDPTSTSFSGSKTSYQWRPVMQLISCGGGCSAPLTSVTQHDYQSATIQVTGSSNSYELEYGTDPSNLGNLLTSSTGTFSISGLQPTTTYYYHARKSCEDNQMSPWASGFFTTDDLPCLPVTNLHVAGTGYSSVDLTWTAGSDETAWEVKVYNNIDTVSMTTALASATVTGLMAQTGYYANVRPLCGDAAEVPGPWSDSAVYFTTDLCQPVTNVTVTSGATTATVAWTAPSGATNFRVAYGPEGFPVGGETGIYNVTSNPFELTDLEPETPYTVQVANVCSDDLVSAWARADFLTLSGDGIADIDGEGNISLFPNPASTTVTIGLAEVSDLTIVDLNGREVFRANAVSSATIDVSTYAKGAYFVRVVSESGTSVRKLVVK